MAVITFAYHPIPDIVCIVMEVIVISLGSVKPNVTVTGGVSSTWMQSIVYKSTKTGHLRR